MVHYVDPLRGGRKVWEVVYGNASNASPYLTPSWIESWLQVFSRSLKPGQLVVVDGESRCPLGTCLVTTRSTWRAVLPLRRAYLNSDGENTTERSVIEHNAILAAPGHEATVYTAVAQHLERLPVDELRFSGAKMEEIDRLSSALPTWAQDIEWRDAPYVDLQRLRAEGNDAILAMSRNSREQLRRAIRQFEQVGALHLEEVSDPATASESLGQLIALHERFWNARGQSGGFATPRRKEFHSLVVQSGLGRSQAKLFRIWCGARLLGVIYLLIYNGHAAFYQSGFDYTIVSKSKPGLVGHHLAIQHCLQAGYREYDFLPSAPGDGRYKRSLSNATRTLGTLTLYRPGWRNSYFRAIRRVRGFFARAR